MPAIYKELNETQQKLEDHYSDMQDLEFTMQDGKLWLLQTRNGKRTGAAMIKIAIDMLNDGSIDETVAVAGNLDLELIVHPHNAGYGANQKTCYMEALRQGAEIVVMLHPDGQYDPDIIPQMIAAIRDGQGDFVHYARELRSYESLSVAR